MVGSTNSLLPVLRDVREEYVAVGEEVCRLLRMVGARTPSFEQEQAVALAQSGVDGVIDRAHAGNGEVSECEIRAFAAVFRQSVERGCRMLTQNGIVLDYPESIWGNGVRLAGAGELLGIPDRHVATRMDALPYS